MSAITGNAGRDQGVGAVPQLNRLPDDFTFSQSNLQMAVDCKRRFYLTHIERLPWPAIEAAPFAQYEDAMRQGSLFHRLVQRGIVGVPVDGAPLEPPLDAWMAAWQATGLRDVPTEHRLTEHLLAATLRADNEFADHPPYRVVAKYDLIAAEVDNGRPRVVILDWKTSARRPEVESVRQRLQSILYPWLLVESSGQLPFGAFAPEDVEMRYWYAGAPDAPIRLRYDRAQHEANRLLLGELLTDLLRRAGEDGFPKVEDTPANRRRFCNFCVYRSRCQRADVPGNMLDYDESEDAEIGAVEVAVESYSLDTITELEF